MIRKLRLRFALTAMLSVLAVLVVLVGGINIFNYRKVVSDSDTLLAMLADNKGSFPERKMPPDDMKPDGNPFADKDRLDSPEIAFETRYFSAVVTADGTAFAIETDKISAIDKDTAAEYAGNAVSSGKANGFIGEYRFIAVPQPDGNTLVVFCDCGASLANFRGFLKISLIISVVSYIAICAVIYLISGKAVRPVAESYEKQKRFITDAGHEIKTPLAIINADADVLVMENGGDNEWISDIKKQTGRLTELTNSLIFLSKMEEGTASLVMEDLDISEKVRQQAESFKTVAMTCGKEFVCETGSGIRIKGDAKSIDELISILLDNAVKYCPEGGMVSIRCSQTGKGAKIEVSNDTSEDLDSSSLDRLFDRFYRTDSSRNSETGGHGLGLSIAKTITEAHGGKISVSEKADGKITFTVLF